MARTYILDASAFILGALPEGKIVTTPAVYGEVKDESSRLKLELLEGLRVVEPLEEYLELIGHAAAATGDDKKLTNADRGLLALALEQRNSGNDIELLTDDYAVQNVAARLGIAVKPLRQAAIRQEIRWVKRCIGCNRLFEEGDTCPVCGSPLRLKKAPGGGDRHEKRQRPDTEGNGAKK